MTVSQYQHYGNGNRKLFVVLCHTRRGKERSVIDTCDGTQADLDRGRERASTKLACAKFVPGEKRERTRRRNKKLIEKYDLATDEVNDELPA